MMVLDIWLCINSLTLTLIHWQVSPQSTDLYLIITLSKHDLLWHFIPCFWFGYQAGNCDSAEELNGVSLSSAVPSSTATTATACLLFYALEESVDNTFGIFFLGCNLHEKRKYLQSSIQEG